MGKKKRGNGEGSIYRRKDGRWVGQYTVYTARGPNYRYLYGKTRQDVAEKLTKAIADRDSGLVFDAGTVTLSEYLERWLSDSVKDTVRPRTWERYEQNSRIHIIPTLGRIKLKGLSPAHVRGLYRQKLESGLSPRTVQYIHQTHHKALKQAVADGLIPRNVAEAVKAPRLTKQEIQPLDPDQVRAFLKAAAGDRLEALYVLAVSAGMRQGELLGLRWKDVDLRTGMLQVRRALASTKGGVAVYYETKSGKGRSVTLSHTALESLKRHRRAQNEERLRLGSLWEDHGLVFLRPLGRPIRRWWLARQSFTPLLERAGLPGAVTFHGLRHTCATLMLTGGIHTKVVQEMLGHADASITLNIYSHVLPNMQNEAARKMDSLLSENG